MGRLAFHFTRTGNISQPITVTYSIGGSATPDVDYTALSGSVSFAAQQDAVDVPVDPIDDSVPEFDESVEVALTAGTGYTVGDSDTAVVIIRDNDTPVISVQATRDAAEGGTPGQFTFVRMGDKSGTLTVNYSLGGTATNGTDFTALSGTVVFAAGDVNATVDVAATDDTVYDPDETVELTITSGTGYTVDSQNKMATVSVADDVDTVETLIHQEDFVLTGPDGTANVTLSVVYNASGASGQYTWTYVVQNPSSSIPSWTSFSIPIDNTDGVSDVANLSSDNGWTGSVGTDSIGWSGGTPLTSGNTATFSFTTATREVGPATVTISAAGGSTLAQLPTAPAPRRVADVPSVNMSFAPGGQEYTLKLSMTQADGSTGLDSGNMEVFATGDSAPTTARDYVYGFLKDNGWAVEKAGTSGLRILGKLGSDGKVVAPLSLNWRKISGNDPPTLYSVGPVTVTNN